MINTEDVKKLIHQLQQLTEAVQEQNRLIKSCIVEPDGQPPRLLVGAAGVVETINL